MSAEPPDRSDAPSPLESGDTVVASADSPRPGGAVTEDAVAPTMLPHDAIAATVTPEFERAATSTPEGGAGQTAGIQAGAIELAASPLQERGFRERYAIDQLLGRGGMGEVRTCRDSRLGRDVAVKSMRHAPKGEALTRFVREARVQGQLEHPAIVPVYDIGVDPEGAPYFTMKRLRGMTLEQMLVSSANGDAALEETFPLRKLLFVFITVCQAMEFAHSRGVLHRDLKPGNVMLGDFGEVYLLDWGLARIAGVSELQDTGLAGDDDMLAPGVTAHGSIMGTPGYMAPEQLSGRTDEVDERSDVYALGAILFEILTLEPLHDRGSAQSLVDSTLEGADARATTRCPDRGLAPELDAVCVRATAQAMDHRYASVQDLRETVERFLDGDRDLERRHELAEQYADRAASSAESLFAGGGQSARKSALRAAGRSLALEPENARAAAVLTQLMLTPPDTTPPEVEEALTRSLRSASQEELRGGAFVYAAHFLAVPFLLWLGVKSWPLFIAMGVIVACMGVWTWRIYKSGRISAFVVYTAAVVNLGVLVLMSRMFGPFILVPAITTVGTLGFLFHRDLVRPWIIVLLGCGGIIVPVVLELTGVLAPTYEFSDGYMVVTSTVLALPKTATLVSLAAFSVTTLLASVFFISAARDAQLRAERQVHMQAWQLRQLVPESAHGTPEDARA